MTNVVPRIKLLESWRKRPSHVSFTGLSTTPTFILPKIWTGHIHTYPQDRQSLGLLARRHAEGEAFRARLKCLGKEVGGERGDGEWTMGSTKNQLSGESQTKRNVRRSSWGAEQDTGRALKEA